MPQLSDDAQNASCTATDIIRSASVIACSATGYACLLEDIMDTCDVMENSTNINAPTSGPSQGAANEIVQSAGVAACSASGILVPTEDLARSLRVLENAGNDTEQQNSPEVDTTDHVMVSASSASSTSGTTGGQADTDASGFSTRRRNSTRPFNTTGRSRNTDVNMTRADRGFSRHSSQSDLRNVCQFHSNRVTRSSLRSGPNNTADGNVFSVTCTTRAARSNSFRARRDALKARNDSSRVRHSSSRADSAANGVSNSNTSSASDSSGRNMHSTSEASGFIRRSTTATTNINETTTITVRTVVDIPLTTPGTNNEITSDASGSTPLRASDRAGKAKRSSKRKSGAIPLPAGDGSGRITRSTSTTSSAIPLPPCGEPEVTARSATVTSIAITVPANDTSGTIKRSATITSGTVVLPIIDGSEIVAGPDPNAVLLPNSGGPDVIPHSASNRSTALSANDVSGNTLRSANDTSGDIANATDAMSSDMDMADTSKDLGNSANDILPIETANDISNAIANDISNDIANDISNDIDQNTPNDFKYTVDSANETLDNSHVTAANIIDLLGANSGMTDGEAETDMNTPLSISTIMHSANITVHPLSPAISLPSDIATPSSTIDTVSAIGLSSSGDERSSDVSADADGNYFF